MPDKTSQTLIVDMEKWVEIARSDPSAYFERQATEVFLTALGMAKPYCEEIFLKGGILMGIVYQSPRQTADIDLSSTLKPSLEIADRLKEALDAAFPRASAALGYPDLICKVQTVKPRPRPENFASAIGAALDFTIGYAQRGSKQERRLDRNNSPHVLNVDISFNEPIGKFQVIQFGEGGEKIHAYSLIDMISEKLRALLQQETRNRYRRQDVYDIFLLIETYSFDENEKENILKILKLKCAARQITPESKSLSSPEVIRRASAGWDTLKLEIGELPDFNDCFVRVDAFYRSLPWG